MSNDLIISGVAFANIGALKNAVQQAAFDVGGTGLTVAIESGSVGFFGDRAKVLSVATVLHDSWDNRMGSSLENQQFVEFSMKYLKNQMIQIKMQCIAEPFENILNKSASESVISGVLL